MAYRACRQFQLFRHLALSQADVSADFSDVVHVGSPLNNLNIRFVFFVRKQNIRIVSRANIYNLYHSGMNMKWYDLAKTLMKSQGINQEQLAEHLGITKGAVSHWLNARREPSLSEIAKILQFLGKKNFSVGAGGLIIDDTLKGDVEYAGPYIPGNKYPVISSVQAGSWCEAVEPYTLKDIDLWLESNAHIQGDAFWLLVEGESMTAPTGLSIPEGTYVLFDTGRDAVNGSLVIAKLSESNEATFKKLVIDGGQRYLKGLNPQWPLVPINGNCRIIGVAVETKLRLV